MRGTSQAVACLVAVALAGCSGGRTNRDTGAAGTGAETGAMSDTSGMSGTSGMSADTGMKGMSTDTGTPATPADTGRSSMRSGAAGSDTGSGSRMHSDSARGNQTKSGVTNTKTGKSTLGPGATKTRPDQGQPVTSKGDTISPGVDSTQR
jgi:hypothetical protein